MTQSINHFANTATDEDHNDDVVSWNCAIHLNNQGAMLLEQGAYNSACVVLCSALKVGHNNQREGVLTSSKKLLIKEGSGNQGQSQHEEEEGDHDAKHRSTKVVESIGNNSVVSPSVRREQEDDAPLALDYIFRTPLILSQDDDPISNVAVSSAILCNLALAQFLLAVECDDDSSSKRMIGALQMYEIVYSLQQTNGTKDQPQDQLPWLHLLGLINNSAYLHRFLNRPKKSNRLFQHLLTSLMLIVLDKNNDVTGLECFFAATSHLVLRDNCVARAA